MKVSLKWLQEYIDSDLSLNDLVHRLTLAGTEAKVQQIIGSNWGDVVVGQITAINPHPNADRLSLPTVNLGDEQETVVCGAPNLEVGDKVAFARVGAKLNDGHSGQLVTLKPAKIRGVFSSGMVCSEKELGISDNHETIIVLPAEAPVGTPLADYLGDTILDLEVTPNRPDCLSLIGIAREIAALTKQSICLPKVSYKESATPIEQQVSVDIVAPDLCPRYCTSLITGIKLAESPKWMQQRLLACGMRPINNIVDITNYVMLEYGQPLHAFDYHQIRGSKIIVRRANNNENIVTLDGVERKLSPETLVIADEMGAVAIAGIMGGANSEVTENTTSILLEAASFNPASIHYTGRTLLLPSEACMRFERGIRAELALPALKRATQLILQLAGGEVAKGVIDVYPGKLKHEPILLSTGNVKRLLGVEFSLDQVIESLDSLGFDCEPTSSTSEVLVTAPYWRSDISHAVDLVEEVARIIGYEKIPMTMLSGSIPQQNLNPIIKLKRELGRALTGYGFQEVINYSLTGKEMQNRLRPDSHSPDPEPLRLVNPMTAEQEYLRINLRANLLTALAANRRHEEDSIRLFELGRIYLSRSGNLPDEPEALCGILSGPRMDRWWQDESAPVDFFDAKGLVESLLSYLGVEVSFDLSQDESLHSNRQANITVAGNRLGLVGEVNPRVLEAFDFSEQVYLFEINVATLSPFTVGHKLFQPIPRFPATVRDIALLVDTKITNWQIQNIIKSFSLVSKVNIFDVYYGGQVPAGKKSLAYRIIYQSSTHTLTENEVNKVQQQILHKLSRELGATLRT